jgi:NADPH:quinone reductase-like Zn-dependent oxidoreductase
MKRNALSNALSFQGCTHPGELTLSGKIKPVIDKTYSLMELPEAHVYVEKGCIVIRH